MSEIRQLRLKRGLTMKDLASRVNINPLTIYRYEQGLRVPDINVAAKIAKVLKCSIDDLVERSETS